MVRAVQRVVRSMVQWGVLRDTDERGVFVLTAARPVSDGIAEVLLEALLLGAEESALPADQLIGHPALFPFKLGLNTHVLRGARQFRVHRQGLDVDVVGLSA